MLLETRYIMSEIKSIHGIQVVLDDMTPNEMVRNKKYAWYTSCIR